MVQSLFQIFKREVLNPKSLSIIVLTAFFYIAFALYLLNYRLTLQTLSGDFPINYKVKLLFILLGGAWTVFPGFILLLLILTSILVGINILLVFRTIRVIKKNGEARFFVGGGSLLGIASTGCGGCGLTLFSLLGISSGFGVFPHVNTGLYLLAIVLLLFSAFYMLNKITEKENCEVIESP